MRRRRAPTRVTLTENALRVLRERYLLRNERLQVVEDPAGLFQRVARAVALADRLYDPRADVESAADAFLEAMTRLEFLPNSPTLMNAGTPAGQLMACFVLPVEDSLESIFQSLYHAALIQRTGGGTGFSFSHLRPRGDVILTTRSPSSGPVSFMWLYNAMTDVIKQESKRRGANMGVLRVDHPDVQEFITCKRDRTQFTNFNISVGVTDAFMEAVERGGEYDLVNPRTHEVVARVPARGTFDLIVENAWDSGEPGILALDTIQRANPTPRVGTIEATNPCGEQPLLPYEACCLGSINLTRFVVRQGDGYQVSWRRLGEMVDLAVHFLDNVVDVNRYPIPQTESICLANRKIGLGVMGFADLLVRMGIPYDTQEGVTMGERIMAFIAERAREASAALAERRGNFPNYPGSVFAQGDGRPRRNATLTTVAPTGTISIIANCSSGIEPLFALAYVRRVMGGVELVEHPHPVFVEMAKQRGFYSKDLMERVARAGSIQGIEEIPEDVRRVFVTAFDIAPEWHVRMQAAFQRHTDNAVSKTINLPPDARKEDVARVFRMAYQLGCKGITVYRYGSRPLQTLSLTSYCLTCADDSTYGQTYDEAGLARSLPRWPSGGAAAR
ncbi:MAG TPA: adenosylcobalamin-dependent ribonucleoside-diphosphate reductase [Chloroflexota bacterium]